MILKKGLFSFVSLLLVAVMCVACTSVASTKAPSSAVQPSAAQTDAAATNAGPAPTEPGTFPVSNTQITLKVLCAPPTWIEDLTTNTFTKWYEEKTNVKLDFQILKSTDAQDKLNLILSSGVDLPDVILSLVSLDQQAAYGAKGIIIPLNDLYDKYGFWSKKTFAEFDDVITQASAYDGKIYNLPIINECLHCQYSQKAWVNSDWLTKLSLSLPTTTDEFEKMLMAFKTRDPNGNTKADEIPYTASPKGWHSDLAGFLMSPFVQYQGGYSYYLNIENGKVVPAFTTEGWKNGIKWIKKLYSEGLIDTQAFTQDGDQMKQEISGDTQIVGAFPAGVQSIGIDPTNPNCKLYSQWISPLKGPDGTQRAMYDKYNYVNPIGCVITNACKYPEIAFRWADSFYEPDVNLFNNWGEKGVVWDDATSGEVGLDGNPAAVHFMIAWGTKNNSGWQDMGPYVVSNSIRVGQAVGIDNAVVNVEKVIYEATTKSYMGFEPKEVLPLNLALSPDEIQQISDIRVAIKNYVDESLAKFVTGASDIDTGWDDYIAQLNKMGLDQFLKVEQASYDRFVALSK